MDRRKFVITASSAPILFSGCLEELIEVEVEEREEDRSQEDQRGEKTTQRHQEREQEIPEEEQHEEEEAVEETPSIEPIRGKTAPSDERDVVSRSYSFRYERMRSQFEVNIPRSLVEYYESRHRDRRDYGVYLADTYDDFLIQSYADEMERFGRGHGLSGSEIVEMAIAFVQQLEYTTDEVNNGFSDYPQYPLETLYLRSGDCQDSSILLASLLEKMGYGTVLLLMPDDRHMAVGLSGGGWYTRNLLRVSGKQVLLRRTHSSRVGCRGETP